MKCIIAGSRSITDYNFLLNAIEESKFKITEVISGGALGVDSLGEQWANEHTIPILKFIPEWKKYGKVAGHIRNEKMAKYVAPDGGCIILHDGKSPGSSNMRKTAKKMGLKLFYIVV